MSSSIGSIFFEIKVPKVLARAQDQIQAEAQAQIENEPWLEELSKARAEAFYAKGQRPAFKLDNGEFKDPDTFDNQSYHILAFEQVGNKKKLVGAVRLLPLAGPEYHCVASNITGNIAFKKLIGFFKQNINLEDTYLEDNDLEDRHFEDNHAEELKLMEVNRFFVQEAYQHQILGMNLCAGAWWLGHTLGYTLITNGNIKLVQSLYIKHLGGVPFPYLSGPHSSQFYNDNEIYILYIDKKRASQYLLEQVELIKHQLPSTIPTIAHEIAIAP